MRPCDRDRGSESGSAAGGVACLAAVSCGWSVRYADRFWETLLVPSLQYLSASIVPCAALVADRSLTKGLCAAYKEKIFGVEDY